MPRKTKRLIEQDLRGLEEVLAEAQAAIDSARGRYRVLKLHLKEAKYGEQEEGDET